MDLAMSRYFFNLKTARGLVRDPEGTELPDENTARVHACNVARELMANQDLNATRLWRLDINDGRGRSYFQLPLAPFSPTLAAWPPEIRASVEDLCQKTVSLNDTINQLRVTLLQVKGTIARSEGTPYIAALDGVRL
jgi:hypothetical protein